MSSLLALSLASTKNGMSLFSSLCDCQLKVPHRPFVKGLVNKVSHNIYKGYKTRLQAERAWVLANALGSVRILNGEGDAIAAPSSAIPPLVLGALGEVPEEFLDATWYVVVKGRTPGVYPAWCVLRLEHKHI